MLGVRGDLRVGNIFIFLTQYFGKELRPELEVHLCLMYNLDTFYEER